MAKLRKCSDGALSFHCLGCKVSHGVFVDEPGPNRPVWTWNGSMDAPTFQPSIRVQWMYGEGNKQFCCHSFITDGKIQFLADCTHSLAGQTVEIPDWEAV
jgi:hypothetical protein